MESLVRERDEAKRELARLQDVVAEHEQRFAALARVRRPRPQEVGASPLRFEDPQPATATYTVEGKPAQLEALDLVLAMATSAGELGATVFFDLMVDGDGDGRIVARRDGQVLRLTEQETNVWFMGEDGEQSRRVNDVTREHGRIIVEIV